MALPYMPLYVADYFGDTQHLTCEQDGAYLRILMCLWRRDGYLPLDHGQMARMTKLSAAKWAAAWEVLKPFFQVENGQLSSPRLLRELADAEGYLSQKREASARAHEAKRVKRLNSESSDGVPSTVTVTTRSLFEEESVQQVAQISVHEAAQRIWNEAPIGCRRRSSQAALRTALQAAVNRRKNLGVIIQAVEAYYADPEKAKDNHQWAKGVHRVIQDDYWESWAVAGGVEHLEPGAFTKDQQREALKKWMEYGRSYWQPSLGPTPDEPGSKVSAEIMAEMGYVPPARRAQG